MAGTDAARAADRPPARRARGAKKTAAELWQGTGLRVRGLGLEQLQAVRPDAVIELKVLGEDGASRRVDLLLEVDRTRRPADNLQKFLR